MKRATLISILFFCFWVNAQSEALFKKASDAYNEGNYEKAIEFYNQIIDQGEHSAALYYNLGNSYYKLNSIAPSIYYYEKALLLKPNDEEIKTNLAYAENMTLDAIEILPETGITRIYKNITGNLSFDQWAIMAIVFIIAFVIAYILFYFLRYATHKRIAFISSLVAIFMAVICLVFAFMQFTEFNKEQPAIVFSEEVSVKSEPNKRSSESFVLHEGTKVNVLEELNNYKKIQLVDGKTGWIPSEEIKLLKDF